MRRLGGWNPDDVSDVGGCAEKMVLTGDYLASVTCMFLFQLVHSPGVGLPGPIKIFPFKSLRQLEVREYWSIWVGRT